MSYSTWDELLSNVPQGSISEPLLFNMFLRDLFLKNVSYYFTNSADATTPFVAGGITTEVLTTLTNITQKSTCFIKNQMQIMTNFAFF